VLRIQRLQESVFMKNLMLTFLALIVCTVAAEAQSCPNVVVILADDMGFGELQCLNPTRGKIPTPQLDALAKDGLVFTDGHSGSSVCTPTRYGLMTGRYAWRTTLQSGVLTGGESLIAEDRLTIAKLLKKQGYDTAMVGKWHLGMLYDGEKNSGKIPVGAKVSHGPVDRGGFDYFRGFHHARQMDLWIEDDTVTQRLTPVEMLPKLTETAVTFIRGRKGNDKPFFLYVPWNSPHSPVAPSKDWQGKSGLNEHADFVMQTDHSFGRVIDALKETGQFDNTLVICSSDNGTSAPTSKMENLKKAGHYSSGDLRGSKADIWDGGHRVPFIASWPVVIKEGRRTDALVCLTDVIATVADILDAELPDSSAEDSISFLNVLNGQGDALRRNVIHHSVEGQFAIRGGQWKLICCPGSGGWSKPGTREALQEIGPEGPFVQLYDMKIDLSEQKNLAGTMADKTTELRRLLDRQIADGRSTPGAKQQNEMSVVVDKWKKASTKPERKGRKKKSAPESE
jgi:arylsulfatase A